MSEPDDALIVEVLHGVQGGYLPVGEFARVHKDLAETKERLQRMSDMLALARLLWAACGFVVGLVCGVMLHG